MNTSIPDRNVAHLDLKPGDLVIDLGTGMGHYALAAARVVDISGKVFAVDIQEDLLKEVARKARDEILANVVPIHADIEKESGTGIETDSLDAAIIANALFQVEEKELFLREAYRVLKPGGKILIVDWSDSFGGMGPSSEFIVTKEELIRMMSHAGFSVLEEISAGDHHYGLIFKK